MGMHRLASYSGRLRYAADNLIWLWLALAAIASSITFFLDPNALSTNIIGRALHPLDFIWNTGFGLSGLLILIGILRPRPEIEAAGLMVFSAALILYWGAILAVIGTAQVGVFAYPALICAAILRVFAMLRLAQEAKSARTTRE